MAHAREAFADGEDVAGVGDEHAYWSPTANVLWFDAAGNLYAVQLTNATGDSPARRDLTRAIAAAALPNL